MANPIKAEGQLGGDSGEYLALDVRRKTTNYPTENS